VRAFFIVILNALEVGGVAVGCGMQGGMRTGGPRALKIGRGRPTIPAMRVRSRPLRTLNGRMLVWLSVMLAPLIVGGVVGLVLQQYRLHESRVAADRVATKFLTLERTHHLLHDAEVAATARLLAPSDGDMAGRQLDAATDARRSLRRLEAVTGPAEAPYVRRARMLLNRAMGFSAQPRTRPGDEEAVRELHLDVFDAQDTLDALTDVFAGEVHDSGASARDQRLQGLALALSFLLSSLIAVLLALRLRRAIARPFAALRDSARRLGGGDLAHRVELHSFAELNEVAESLNVMARRLEDSRRELSHQAFHDDLTGLANRTVLFDRVDEALGRAGDRAVAVLFVDVDDFKAINDSLGHSVGDRVLTHLAARLRDALRPTDVVARLGGDEFAVLLEDMPDADHGAYVAERILLALSAPTTVGGIELSLGASIGVAVATAARRMTAEELMQAADLAMYAAKADGKRRYRTFDPAMLAGAIERLELEADLKRALENDELDVHYQPIVELATGYIRAVEALARWTHPVRGPIRPDVFIGLAEQTGLIVPLGRRLLARACADLPVLRERLAHPGLLVGVNLSARELLDPQLPAEVEGALAAAGLEPGALTVEITESVLMSDVEAAKTRLAELKALGVKVALDDFGTGYSSLAYLREFPVDCLKIDRAFSSGVADPRSEDHQLVRTIVDLGRTRGMLVIAEGIEDSDQHRALESLGCELGQGFHFCRPLPADALAETFTGAPVIGA
jgi:diguanylate cyclase (GGDEF)-like protein